ncbi:BglG family transcription antiterminator [Clostridium polynesiense]|uniref:BglG family transcription antiterminator n=1 Tax=Clostridium polynesiense TaxID=1325933 RepID=UPI0006948369|nr:BglG family transcription antiterminator [Clostridium polynesiense]
MNISLRDILLFLINHNTFTSVKELAEIFSVSTRTIYSSLKSIDEFLVSQDMKPLERVKGKGLRCLCTNEEKREILRLLQQDQILYLSPEERRNRISIYVLTQNTYSTIDEISNILKVSRNTVITDIAYIKEWMKDFSLNLETYPYKGLCIVGKEINIRKALLKILLEEGNTLKSSVIVLGNLLSKDGIQSLEDFIDLLEVRLRTPISDISYYHIRLSFAIALSRMQKGCFIDEHWEQLIIEDSREYKALCSLKDRFDKQFNISIPKDELIYLSSQLISSSTQGAKDQDGIFHNWIYMQLNLRKFILAVEKDLQVELIEDNELFQGLLMHIRPAYYRILNGLSFENPILTQIKEQFSHIHKSVIKNLHLIESRLNISFTEEEASFLTMYFAAAVERKNRENKKIPTAAIVCTTGTSTSQILLSQLTNRFQINIVGAFSSRNIDKLVKREALDLIITTVDIEAEGVEIIKVNPILSQEDIANLSCVLNNISSKFNIKRIINIIKKYGNISDETGLAEELAKYLQPHYKNEKKHLERRKEPMLIEILNENLVEVNADVKTREEAIIKSGTLLYKNDLVEERYIQAMLDNLEEHGTYIVIAPGIAMPHARPENGVKDIGISIVTLKNPVVFGHKTNDPVRIVIGLCAIDHQTHLAALTELVNILKDESCIEGILNADSSEEIINIIKEVK